MHVGAKGSFAERVGTDFVGAINPATIVGVFKVIRHRPANPGRCEILRRALDAFRDAPREEFDIIGIGAAAQATHR